MSNKVAKQLTPKQFYQILKKERNVPSPLLLTGTEYSLMLKIIDHVREVLEVSEENMKVFEGKDISIGELYDYITTSSLFGSNKMLVFRDARSLCGYLREKSLKELLLMASGKIGLCLVFVDFVEDEKKSDSKAFQVLVDSATVINCRRPGEKEIRDWLTKKLKKLGIEDEELVEYLIESTNCSYDVLEKELEKISLYSDRSALINAKVYSPFELVTLALSGNFKALEALDYLIDSGVYPPLIVGAIQKKLRNLLLYKLGILTNLTPYQKMIMDQEGKNLSLEDLKEFLLNCFILERRVKTGSLDPKEALSDFVINILMKQVRANN